MADIKLLRETTLKDVPATLRNIADDIERSEFGDVKACVVVLDAFKLHTFYMGTGEAAPNAYLLLGAAAGKMVARVLEEKT